jgi:hypothetical protein
VAVLAGFVVLVIFAFWSLHDAARNPADWSRLYSAGWWRRLETATIASTLISLVIAGLLGASGTVVAAILIAGLFITALAGRFRRASERLDRH